jgi:GNAT superfamily N-acetyltransferase
MRCALTGDNVKDKEQKMATTTIDSIPGYTIRVPEESDIPAIIALVLAHDIAETGNGDPMQAADVLDDWKEIDLTSDAWVILSQSGQLCGYANIYFHKVSGRLFGDGYVHPEHYGHGIGTLLVNLLEARASAIVATSDIEKDVRLVLVNQVVENNTAAIDLLTSRGYTRSRVFFTMHILLEEPLRQPEWPQGISVRICSGSEDDIRATYEVVNEGFRDHWGYLAESFEGWKKHVIDSSFEPTLWFLACEGEHIVGVALCREKEDANGWIRELTVLRPWRKRGLATALLMHVFQTFHQRGFKRVGLGVDGQSLTGAQRLYESVGMQTTMRIARYEKELRPGRNLVEVE